MYVSFLERKPDVVIVHVSLCMYVSKGRTKGRDGAIDKWWVEMYSCMNMCQAIFCILWRSSRMMCGRNACARALGLDG